METNTDFAEFTAVFNKVSAELNPYKTKFADLNLVLDDKTKPIAELEEVFQKKVAMNDEIAQSFIGYLENVLQIKDKSEKFEAFYTLNELIMRNIHYDKAMIVYLKAFSLNLITMKFNNTVGQKVFKKFLEKKKMKYENNKLHYLVHRMKKGVIEHFLDEPGDKLKKSVDDEASIFFSTPELKPVLETIPEYDPQDESQNSKKKKADKKAKGKEKKVKPAKIIPIQKRIKLYADEQTMKTKVVRELEKKVNSLTNPKPGCFAKKQKVPKETKVIKNE